MLGRSIGLLAVLGSLALPLGSLAQSTSPGPEDSVATQIAAAEWKLANQDWRGGIQDLTGVIEAEGAGIPIVVLAYLHRGMAYQRLGQPEEAIADLTWVALIEPEEVDPDGLQQAKVTAYQNRGVMYLEDGDWERAKSDFEQAIDWDPEQASSYANRALAWARLGDFEQVLSDANEALRWDPELALGHQLRGIARYHLGDIDGSLADFEQALERDTDSGTAYQNRGIVYAELGETDAAMADLAEARERLVGEDYDLYQIVIQQLSQIQP